ncbi:DsbA family oxidoreductase [Longispora albida]|uniref:DsbA family oxidoreductase n=1 Tax=Longispora albida TaxID=203523 RepID=UPI000369FE1E|nr:DsbA family oxidoreductase [Longispora albida]
MKIEMYSDVASPFCYLAHRRLGQALAILGDPADIEIVHRPYQLEPNQPDGPVPLRESMAVRYGCDQYEELTFSLLSVGRDDGIDFRLDRAQAVNTLQAHRLLAFTGDKYGHQTQVELKTHLFAAYFTDGADLSDHGQLAELAGRAGVDPADASHYLTSDHGVEQIRGEIVLARTMVSAVPTVVAGPVRLSGAQPVSCYLDLLRNRP